MPTICLVNASKLDDATIAFAAAAVDAQLREDFLPAWLGVDYTPVSFYANAKDLPTAEGIARLMIVKDEIDQPGALGYHAFADVPYSVILAEGEQTSVTISHEALEMTADPNADRWVKMPDGREVAVEVADPVEAMTYTKATTILGETRQVPVSAFVGPAWFQPSDPGAFQLSPGGYMIVLGTDGKTVDVFGKDAAAERIYARLANPTSRMRRRGATPF